MAVAATLEEEGIILSKRMGRAVSEIGRRDMCEVGAQGPHMKQGDRQIVTIVDNAFGVAGSDTA